jgi:DNA-binding response OmpR family regulator
VKVLLVEDDDAIAQPLSDRLEREGYRVMRARTGESALAGPQADLVLLDLRLPDIDGTEVCRKLRLRSQVPIIVVSARNEEADRVVGLELGADDYIVKPFGFRELLARMRAVMRRSGARDERDGVSTVGALTLDRRSRSATLNGRELRLTVKEFDVLALLLEDPGRAITRRRIFEVVWGSHWYGPTKTLDVHIASIRRKLGDPRWIETVRGVGFRVSEPP